MSVPKDKEPVRGHIRIDGRPIDTFSNIPLPEYLQLLTPEADASKIVVVVYSGRTNWDLIDTHNFPPDVLYTDGQLIGHDPEGFRFTNPAVPNYLAWVTRNPKDLSLHYPTKNRLITPLSIFKIKEVAKPLENIVFFNSRSIKLSRH